MTQLRKPAMHAARIRPRPLGVMPGPAIPLINGVTCRGCKWTVRCRQDGWCWSAEKLAIARERGHAG